MGFAGFLSEIFGLLITGAVSVMQYNGFSDSVVVSAGWVIVRDVMNIFFVMVLIVIAMGTMFGATNRFKWYQQVPRLLLFALLINFSRTICVIMIDFGQVVMLTFANAMKGMMAGNFISVFGIDALMRFSKSADTGFTGYGFFAAALMTVGVLVAVIITMGILVMILIYRIVLLWVLIVLSPLAFFLGGAKDLFGQEGYAKWWGQFKCAVLIGPILAFFVWLTLSVAGAGNMAVTTGFTTASAGTQNLTNSLSSFFETANFLSLLISLGMLYAGFDAAMSFCGTESIVSGLVGRAKKYVGGAAKLTAGGAATLALFGTKTGAGAARGIGRTASRGASDVAGRIPLARNVFTTAGRAELLRKGSAAAATRGFGTTARVLGGAAERGEARVAGDYMQAGKKVEGMSRETLINSLSAVAIGGRSLLPGQRREQDVMFAKAMADPKMRRELQDKGHLDKLVKTFEPDMGKLKYDKNMAQGIGALEESRPGLMGKLSNIRTIEDVRKMDPADFTDKKVQEHLKGMTDVPDSFANKFEPENKRPASVYDYLASGRMGAAIKTALVDGRDGELAKKTSQELAAMAPENVVGDLNMELVNKSEGMVTNIMNSSHPAVQKGLQEMDPAVYGRMLEASTGITPTGEIKDAAKLSQFATGNAAAIGNIAPAAMSPAVMGVVASGVTGQDFQQMATRIQKDPKANENLKENFKKISEEIDKGDYDEETKKGAKNFDRQMQAMDKRLERQTAAIEAATAGGAGPTSEQKQKESEFAGLSAEEVRVRLGEFEAQLADMQNTFVKEQQAIQDLFNESAEAAKKGQKEVAAQLKLEAGEKTTKLDMLRQQMTSVNSKTDRLKELIY